ncbi:hypothetical protein HED60_16675 [Planctomycetales bacterium ZRK34]|nr:hypothetical protein HED60_16675 [Planctomycetales bacterium ZRK34]
MIVTKFKLVERLLRLSAAAMFVWTLVIACPQAQAQVFGTDFDMDYAYLSLGTPSGVTGPLGGINFLDNDTLLIGGSANNSNGSIYTIDVVRDAANHITGFNGSASLFSTAPNIDGGLSYHPDNGVLFFTTYSNNMLGQIKPGSTTPDKMINLTDLGISSSVGTLAFVPIGFAGAGQFKIASYNADTWYTVGLTPDGSGTFDVTSVSQSIVTGNGPEGIVYIKGGSAGFTNDSILLSEYSSNRVRAYEIDNNGDPILATGRDFITGLSGAEGAIIDPMTGDFLFSTFGGGDQILVVSGFEAPALLGTDPDNGGRLNFGFVRIGDTSTMDLTVTNVGGTGSTLTGTVDTATGDFSGPQPDDAISLMAGDSALKSFTYAPTSAGFVQEAITVNTSGGSNTITLQGIGVGPVVDLAPNPMGSTLDAGTADGPGAMGLIEIDLANTFMGAVGDDTLTALSLLSYSITGPDAGLFTLLTPLDVIMAGETLTLQIKFNPVTDGDFEAAFHLLTDLNAAYGEAGTELSWNLIGSASNVPTPAMFGPGLLLAAGMFRRRRRTS